MPQGGRDQEGRLLPNLGTPQKGEGGEIAI